MGVRGRSPSSSRRVRLTSPCDSYESNLSAFSVFLRRTPRLGVWLSDAHMYSHTPASTSSPSPLRSQPETVRPGDRREHCSPEALRLGTLKSDSSLNPAISLHLSFPICKMGTVKPPTGVVVRIPCLASGELVMEASTFGLCFCSCRQDLFHREAVTSSSAYINSRGDIIGHVPFLDKEKLAPPYPWHGWNLAYLLIESHAR